MALYHFGKFTGIAAMAVYARLLTKRHLLSLSRPCLVGRASMAMTAKEEQDKFWQKNATLNRPMSPHLTIYKPQLTSMLSITHRATGVSLVSGVTAFALCFSVLPGDFATNLEIVRSWAIGPALIYLTKLFISWPMFYHTLNGIRHLAWDMGYGLDIKTLYKTGWAVFAISIIGGLGLAAM